MKSGIESTTIEKNEAVNIPVQEINHMAENQFADVSRDLYMQIKVVEDMVKGELFKEAVKLLTTAEETCKSLESLMEEDNKIQIHIVANRQREIVWIQESIQEGMAKSKKKPAVKKRAAKSK
jgi:predicted nucleotidyltransferase